ncbi:MAG: thioredoxin domain-containing protein [Elusimicrobia bacterium]|nr:thioredoxin domain-containing protein [Elusimicrobiota bacterium]
MLPRTAFARHLWAASAVLLASAASVKAVRGHQSQNPYAPGAPLYRQKGEAKAPIVIVEFSDLQCPACRFAVEPLKNLLSIYGQQARLVFKHYPLQQHLSAWPAAVAAECAGRQGRFWDLHDLLYDKQADWAPPAPKEAQTKAPPPGSPQDFIPYARSLGLDMTAFSACLKDPTVSTFIEADRKDGDDHWVLSTPTFFINGKRFSGARQLSEGGVPWIDKLLKKK